MKQIGWGNFRLFYKSYSTDETLNIFKLFHRANHFALKVKVFLSKLLKQVKKIMLFHRANKLAKSFKFFEASYSSFETLKPFKLFFGPNRITKILSFSKETEKF